MFRLFPVAGASEDGFVENDIALIKKSVITIIHTHKGSRVYDPDFGTNLHLLIHEQNIKRTRNVAKTEIEAAIKKYEPRAEVVDITVYAGKDDKANEAVVVLNLKYLEYGITEELKIILEGERAWMTEEEVPPNFYMGKFK